MQQPHTWTYAEYARFPLRRTTWLASLLVLGCATASAPPRATEQPRQGEIAPGDGWVTVAPSEIGRTTALLDELSEALRRGDAYRNVHAVLIASGGRLVYEEYFAGEDTHRGDGALGRVVFDPTRRHDLRSVTKSVVSALVGIAVGSGAISSVDRPVLEFFPELQDLATPERRAVTLRHVLAMTMGTEWIENIPYTDPKNDEIRMNRSTEPMRIVLDRDVVAPHGSRWNYSGGSTQLLAEVVERATGMRIEEYARQVLWEPLGINDVEWVANANGQASAASGLRLRPRDQLRFGQLYVDDGRWRGRQVVPADWITATLDRSIALPDSLVDLGDDATAVFGYGYQWRHARFTLPYGNFTVNWALGNGGQQIWVVPDLELVAVINAGNYNGPHDGDRLFLERILPWATGSDSAFALWAPRPFRAVTPAEWQEMPLGAAERDRYVGTYQYEDKQVRVWEDEGALYVTFFFGSEDQAIRLVPLGDHVFAYGRYRNGALTGIYWPADRLEFKLQDGRVVAFDDRAESGSVYVTAPRVGREPDE